MGDPDTRRAYELLAQELPHVHLHGYVNPDRLCSEWSKYDAGLMHPMVRKTNKAALFEELNLPYRYNAYLCAGLPLVVARAGQQAMKALAQQQGIGLVYSDFNELAAKLHDTELIHALSVEAKSKRKMLSFDQNADKSVAILNQYALPN